MHGAARDPDGGHVTAAEIVLPPGSASAPRTARWWVAGRLKELGLEPLADAVLLLTSEIVTNALIHAGTEMRVRLRPSGAGVRVEVRDGSGVPPVRHRYSLRSTTGRGLGLLDSLADEWGWAPDGTGKTVWFRVLHPPAAGDLERFDTRLVGDGA